MICWRCKTEKPQDDFPWKNKAKGKRHNDCRECKSVYQREWHAKNAVKRQAQIGAWNKANRLSKREKILTYLESHPCVDCGETDVVVLDFDHRDRSSKVDCVSRLVHQNQSWT